MVTSCVGNEFTKGNTVAILQEHVRSITTKGQVAIPASVRDFLGLRPGEKVVFRVVDDRVELAPAQMTLE